MAVGQKKSGYPKKIPGPGLIKENITPSTPVGESDKSRAVANDRRHFWEGSS